MATTVVHDTFECQGPVSGNCGNPIAGVVGTQTSQDRLDRGQGAFPS
jgi:hypothetical protein